MTTPRKPLKKMQQLCQAWRHHRLHAKTKKQTNSLYTLTIFVTLHNITSEDICFQKHISHV